MRDVQDAPLRVRLTDDFASPLVFSLLAALQDGAELEFRTLRRILQCDGAALSGAIAYLERSRRVFVRRSTFGEAPGTWISATRGGAEAFAGHLAALRQIAEGTP